MPNIVIEGPFIQDIAKKRALVKEVTDAAVKAYALPRQVIVVLIKENKAENVGVGGTLISDRQ